MLLRFPCMHTGNAYCMRISSFHTFYDFALGSLQILIACKFAADVLVGNTLAQVFNQACTRLRASELPLARARHAQPRQTRLRCTHAPTQTRKKRTQKPTKRTQHARARARARRKTHLGPLQPTHPAPLPHDHAGHRPAGPAGRKSRRGACVGGGGAVRRVDGGRSRLQRSQRHRH